MYGNVNGQESPYTPITIPGPEEIREVMRHLREMSHASYNAEIAKIVAETDLERKIGHGLLSGAVGGKNERERDAMARDVYSESYRIAEESVLRHKAAQAALVQARIDVQEIELMIRAADLTLRIVTDPVLYIERTPPQEPQ